MLVVWCGDGGGGGGACALSRRCHCGDIRLGEGSICGRGNELAGKQENGACKNWSCWDSSSLGNMTRFLVNEDEFLYLSMAYAVNTYICCDDISQFNFNYYMYILHIKLVPLKNDIKLNLYNIKFK